MVSAVHKAYNDLTNDLTGDKIKELRQAMGVTQAALAKQVGVTVITMNRWEKGKLRPTRQHRDRIYEIASRAHRTVSEAGRQSAPDFSR
jgi:DNA-binding transcriptional regulator YiaG